MLSRTYLYIALLLFASCVGRDHKYFTNCVDHENTGIDKNIRIDGYYLSQQSGRFVAQFFYTDGTSASLGGFASIKDVEDNISRNDDHLYRSLSWGRCRLEDNIIKDQSFVLKEVFYKVINETWYEITSDSTIVSVKDICRRCAGMPGIDQRGVSTNFTKQTWRFVPFSTKPDPTRSSINNKRWGQCTKRRYRG